MRQTGDDTVRYETVAVVLMACVIGSVTPVAAAPCITATPGCTEWIAPGTAPVRVLVYRSFPLDQKNADITRAVVLVHGAGRDADNYFLHLLAAGFLGSAL